MRKIYRYNRPMGFVKLPLVSVGNVKSMAQFDNGNPMANECPTCTIRDKFWQMVMEETYVKQGIVSLVQVIPEKGDKSEEKKTTKDKYKNIDSVDTVEKAIDYMANEFEIQVTSAAEALREAHKQGVDFPKLKK